MSKTNGKAKSQRTNGKAVVQKAAEPRIAIPPVTGTSHPTVAGAPAAVDHDGKPIRVGCLIENLDNHDDFGRVEYVIEGIVLYRQLGSSNEGCHHFGDLCTWQNEDLRVVEQPASTDDEPADAETHPAAIQAWKMARQLACFQRALGDVEGCSDAKEATMHIGAAIDELFGLAREHLACGDASTEFADAMDKA